MTYQQDVRIVAQYIVRCSIPRQGPLSGDPAPWRTRQDALDALGRIAVDLPPDTAEPLAAEAGRPITEPDRDDLDAMGHEQEYARVTCELGHTQQAMECPACSEAVTGKTASRTHWHWYKSRTSSKRIKALITERLKGDLYAAP